MPAELETVNLEGVEILAAGGPVFGVGSPPEGDFWTEDDLRAMAAAANELVDELKPPNKIGHSDGQQLVLNSGIGQPSDGEMPAVGWLDGATFRVEAAAGDEPAKLLCDIKDVPKKFGDLVKAKAYRTRSVELSRVTSQATGKVYDWVVTGLAWLGAKLPAVRTLDDIVALYSDGIELRRVFAKGDVVWSPTDGYESLRYRVSEALNGDTGGDMNAARFWVRDVATDRALVADWYESDGPETSWIVPFTVGADGVVTVADRDLWTKAEMAWLEAAREFAEKSQPGSRRRASDTRLTMPELTLNEEQTTALAETLGLEGEFDADKLLTAAKEKTAAKPEQRSLEQEEVTRRLEAAEKTAEQARDDAKRANDALDTERKRSFVEGVLSSGRAEPGQRTEIETLYDKDPDAAKKFFESVKPNPDLVREYGSDEDGTEEEQTQKRELEEKDYATHASAHLGIDEKELI